MPELPEVETVKRSLEVRLRGLTVKHVDLLMEKIVKTPDPEAFKSQLVDKTILSLGRRGKYLMIFLSGGLTLIIHLRMTGQLINTAKETELAKHTHMVIDLDNGTQLRFIDQRQFGRVYLLPDHELDQINGLKTMGVEPLGPDFTKEYLKKELKRKRTKIKSLLLDQTFIAGIGNIYADEALHRAKIHPERLACTLNPREVVKLHQAVKEVLTEGIQNRGTSIKDYVDGDGRTGNYQALLRVYGKENEPCHICGTIILRKKIGGRSSFYCAKCQKS